MLNTNRSSNGLSAKPPTKITEMRDSQTLTDVSLKVGDKLFNAHRVVLAASSDYFGAMFTSGMKESFDEVIELKDSSVTPESLEIILDSVYKSELNVTEENVLEVLSAADHLQMKGVIQQCLEFISEKVLSEKLRSFDIRSLQKVLETAEKHSLSTLQEEVYTRMAPVFKELSETDEFLDSFSVHQLLNLLQRNDLTAPSETFVFRSVVKWIYHDKDKRLGHAATLLRAVRLGLVDIRILITTLRRKELMEDKECWNILHEALLYNKMPELLTELTLINTEPRTTSSVLIAIEKSLQLKFYDMTRNEWREFGKKVPITEKCLAVTTFGNFIYIGGEQTVYRYSIDSNTWYQLPTMRHSKGGHPYRLIVVGEYLYAIGNSTERYSFSEITWEVIAQLTRYKANNEWIAANLDGCIYAVSCADAWSFDESKNRWVRKSHTLNMGESRYSIGYNGELIIAGGKIFSLAFSIKENESAKTVQVYCKESDHWSEVEQKHSFYSPFCKLAFEVDNTVFIKLIVREQL